ncbi:MAG: hypothetical protein ACE5KS_01855 [Woeseiaceae bacterium]
MLGQFLEFSVHAPDIIESLAFYKTLGFSELESGDVWSHKYAVVSDGHLCIGLHDRAQDGPRLTFVHRDIARHARAMSDHGFDFDLLKVDSDVFNELAFHDRDGHMISMIEARTFSPPDEDVDKSICGDWFELSLPARDAMRAGRFWAPLAPVMLELREEPTPHLRFDAAGMSLGLSEHNGLKKPSPCFVCDDLTSVLADAERHSLNIDTNPAYESAFLSIEAPEGTRLYLFEADFLAAEEED